MLELICISIFIVGLLLVLYLYQRYQHRHFTEYSYRTGLKNHQVLFELMINVQQHRGFNSAYINGDESFYQPLQQKTAQIDVLLHKLSTQMQHASQDQTLIFLQGAQLERIRKQWSEISRRKLQSTPMENFQLHTDLVAFLLQCLIQVSEDSKLKFHQTQLISHKVQLVSKLLPELTEYIGQVRALASGAAARRQCTPTVKVRLQFALQQMQLVQHQLSKACHRLSDQHEYEASISELNELINQLQSMIRYELLQVTQITIEAHQIFQLASQSIQLLSNMSEKINQHLQRPYQYTQDEEDTIAYQP